MTTRLDVGSIGELLLPPRFLPRSPFGWVVATPVFSKIDLLPSRVVQLDELGIVR